VPALFLVLDKRAPNRTGVGGQRERRRQSGRLGVGSHALRPRRRQRGDAIGAQRGGSAGRATAGAGRRQYQIKNGGNNQSRKNGADGDGGAWPPEGDGAGPSTKIAETEVLKTV
jgi:hypothetical protein